MTSDFVARDLQQHFSSSLCIVQAPTESGPDTRSRIGAYILCMYIILPAKQDTMQQRVPEELLSFHRAFSYPLEDNDLPALMPPA